MSIFGIDWNMDGDVDEMDTLTDLFIIDELEREECEENDDFDAE